MATLKQGFYFFVALLAIIVTASIYFHIPPPAPPMIACFYQDTGGCVEIASGREEEAFKRLKEMNCKAYKPKIVNGYIKVVFQCPDAIEL